MFSENTLSEDLELLSMLYGSPAPRRLPQPKKFSLIRWLRLFPFDRLEFGRIDKGEYFTGLRKFINPS